MDNQLTGLRVLIVEDSYIIAEGMSLLLEGQGISVIGPVSRLNEAIEMTSDTTIDMAVVDINLHGELTFPLIEVLLSKNIPVIVSTGYSHLPELKNMPVRILAKPVQSEDLIDEIRQERNNRSKQDL